MVKVVRKDVEYKYINCPHITHEGKTLDNSWPVDDRVFLQLCGRCYAQVSNSVLRRLFIDAMPKAINIEGGHIPRLWRG